MIEIKALASSSRGNCYHITDGVTPLLLECGISMKEIRKGLGFKTSGIAGCLVSHEHADHSKSAKDLINAGIDIYTSQGTIDALELVGHRVHVVKAKQQFNVGEWIVMPFDVQHDAVEPLGFLLANEAGDKLLFATDTYYIKYKFKGLTHIMVECNYSAEILNRNLNSGLVPAAMKKRIMQSHFSLENVKEFFKANDLSKVHEIWLIHLSDLNSDAARFKREIQELTGKMVIVPGAGFE